MTPEQRQHLSRRKGGAVRPGAAAADARGRRRRRQRPARGSSLEFRDYRDYQPGDDLRHVDWSAYARSDQLSVKLYREEVTPHADIIVDGSRSMALEGSAKEAATLAPAAFFAAAAANAGYTHTAWVLGEALRPVGNGSRPPSFWEGIDFTHRSGPDWGHGCDSRGTAWRPRGVRLLLSDLLWEDEPLATLRPLTERAAVTVVVQVLVAADARPEEGGNLRLVDAESEQVRVDLHGRRGAAALTGRLWPGTRRTGTPPAARRERPSRRWWPRTCCAAAPRRTGGRGGSQGGLIPPRGARRLH